MTQEHESYRDALREAGEDADESLLSVHASLAAQLGALRSPERDDDDPVPGYDLLAELHQGGQGIVYRALQRSTQRQVAVKLLLGGFHASPRKLRRFQREIELVATLDHPNIATVHDSGVTPDGRPFFVMELIQGEPLGARLRQRSLGGRSVNEPTTREMLRIVLDVCRAVHYAHQRGVLHRDLKPGNVLVDGSGAPHVVDFGLGVPTDEVVAAGSRLTRTGEFMGTLAYASPEHVCGIPEEIDVRSDVYCLGVMLYEVLTGELPYPVEGPILDVVRHIQTTAPKLPTAVRRLRSRSGSVERVLAGVDRDLDTIVQRALAKEKNRRYQTAGELGADLDRYLEGQPILARGESTWYVLKKALLRHRAATAAVVTVLVSLVVATVVSLTAWKRAVHAAEEAQTQAGVAEREALRAEEIVAYLQATMFAVTPDQARGHAVTVREVLDESTAMLDEARFKSPAAEYELRVTIGKTYQELGLSREAERQFRAAAPLAEALFGAGSFELCDLELSRSGAAISLAEYQRARRLAEGVLLALDAAEQPNHGLRGLAHSHLANIHAITGEPERAEEHLQASQAAYSQRYGVDSPQVAGLYDTQARILLMRGQFDAAEELAQEAHARWQATDAGGVGAARALQVLGEISRERGDYPTARERCLRETALVRQLYGDEHPRALVARSALAIIDLHLRGPDAVAEEVEAIYALRPGLETRDLFTARTLHNLGSLLEHLAEYDRAEEVLVEAIARFDQIFEDDTVDRNAALGLRGWVLLRLGRSMEARALIEEALTRIQKLGGERTPSEANFRLQLAWVLFQSGEAEVAIEEARTALAIRRQFYPAEHDQVNSAQADLGLFH
ncbi:MAG: serine/threonine-protein kinase, partial [Planctomycetota bacterium]|nr:serine/threonine-protein kinase [Planctomycetota bacterium]